MPAQAVGVAQRADRCHQKGVVLAHGPHHGSVETEELEVLHGRFPGRQEVYSGVGLERPVAVLSAAVHPLEGLLVENHLQVVFLRHLLHHNHQEHILVDGGGDFGKHGGAFKLVGSHFVMTGLERNAQLVGLGFKVFHEQGHAGRDGPEIVVGQLLVFGRCVADHRAGA